MNEEQKISGDTSNFVRKDKDGKDSFQSHPHITQAGLRYGADLRKYHTISVGWVLGDTRVPRRSCVMEGARIAQMWYNDAVTACSYSKVIK